MLPRLLLVALLATATFAQEAPPDAVAQLIRDLDDDDPAKREEATVRLMEFGSTAEAPLRAEERNAPPEARERIRQVLLALEWELPLPLRRKLGPRLAEFPRLTFEARKAAITECEKELAAFPLGFAHVVAVAWEREADNVKQRAEIGALFAKVPGAVHILARRTLARTNGAAGLAALRAVLASLDVSNTNPLEAPLAVCAVLRDSGLGDLATPGFASMLLNAAGGVALCEAAAALETAGHAREAILLYRRGVALDPAREKDLKRLDALCTKENWGAAHLAFLKWLPAGTEAGIERARLEKAGNLPPVDLSDAVRLRGWTMVPRAGHHLLVNGVLYSAGEWGGYWDGPAVAAYDARSGGLLWTYGSPREPASHVELADDYGTCLFANGDSVFLLTNIDSKLGSGGRLGRTARHVGLTRLGRDGKAAWSREYDLNPSDRFEFLGDDIAWFSPGGHQGRGRAWILRLSDGQVVASPQLPESPAFPGPGRLMLKKMWSTEYFKVGESGLESVWDAKLLPEITVTSGEPAFVESAGGLFATTGRHSARVDVKTGETSWTHAFDPDETTVGLAVRGGDVFVVLDAGGQTWKVVTLDATSGKPGTEFEAQNRTAPQRPYNVAERSTWVSPGAFTLAGRLVDVVSQRVLNADLDEAAGLPALHCEAGIPLSGGSAPVPCLLFDGVIVTIGTSASPISTAILRAQADSCEKVGHDDAAAALRKTAVDLDPIR